MYTKPNVSNFYKTRDISIFGKIKFNSQKFQQSQSCLANPIRLTRSGKSLRSKRLRTGSSATGTKIRIYFSISERLVKSMSSIKNFSLILKIRI